MPGAIPHLAERVHARLKRLPLYWKLHGKIWHVRELPFDRKHGVDTSGILAAEDLGHGDSDAWGYMGTPAREVQQAIRALQIERPEFTFVDIGSGKGRAALIASQYGFRAVVGIEISKSLHDVALQNYAAWREKFPQTTPVELFHGSALEITLPDSPLVLYLYNPFAADAMAAFLERVDASHRSCPRPILLLYRNPTCAGQLESHERFQHQLVRGLPRHMSVYEYKTAPVELE